MTRGRDTRLASLEAPAAGAASAKIRERCALSARAKVCALVGKALAQAGSDPACAPALHPAANPDFFAASGPDSFPASGEEEQSGEFVLSGDDGLASTFAAKIGDIARNQDGHEPDFARASLAELLAWSLARLASPAG